MEFLQNAASAEGLAATECRLGTNSVVPAGFSSMIVNHSHDESTIRFSTKSDGPLRQVPAGKR